MSTEQQMADDCECKQTRTDAETLKSAQHSLVRQEEAMKPGEVSKTEDRTTRFTNALTGNCGGVLGILRKRTRSTGSGRGRDNKPYTHQRKCAKRALPENQRRMLLCHDPGTGKTFTFLLIVAAMHTLCKGVRRKTLITSPAACLDQWKQAVLDTLRIPEARILMTNKLCKITDESLAAHDIIIVSRDLVGRAYSLCHEWVTRHHQNERGNWLSQWDVRPGVPMHPLFTIAYNLVGFDEIHCELMQPQP